MSDKQTMVERVAKALCASYCAPHESPDLFWEGNEENHRRTARAAIEAMREPTPDMARAGFSANRVRIETDRRIGAVTKDAVPAWRAMIDAALAEKKDG